MPTDSNALRPWCPASPRPRRLGRQQHAGASRRAERATIWPARARRCACPPSAPWPPSPSPPRPGRRSPWRWSPTPRSPPSPASRPRGTRPLPAPQAQGAGGTSSSFRRRCHRAQGPGGRACGAPPWRLRRRPDGAQDRAVDGGHDLERRGLGGRGRGQSRGISCFASPASSARRSAGPAKAHASSTRSLAAAAPCGPRPTSAAEADLWYAIPIDGRLLRSLRLQACRGGLAPEQIDNGQTMRR